MIDRSELIPWDAAGGRKETALAAIAVIRARVRYRSEIRKHRGIDRLRAMYRRRKR